MPSKVYHRTTPEAATAILKDGFRDAEGNFLTRNVYRGVWLSDRPLDENEGAWGDRLLEVVIEEEAVAQYEWIEEGKQYREWLVPAELVNRLGSARLLSDEEEYELI